MEVSLKRTILASVTVGLAALVSFGCGSVVSDITGRENDSNVSFTGPAGGNTGSFRIFAIDVNGDLLSFRSNSPGTLEGRVTPTGLPAGERLTGIDFRPNTAVLYGITNLGKLHYIDKTTGQCFLVGNGLNPGQAFANDIDFDPVVDAIRQISNSQNARVNANNGTTLAVDTSLTAAGNPITGGCGTAYTNSFAGATTTTLFTVDSATSAVYRQAVPNNGVLDNAVPFPFFIANTLGFDIAPNHLGFVAATPSGSNTSQLLSFDPGSGNILPLGDIAGGRRIQTMAVEIDAPAVTNFVGIDEARNLVRFSSTSPQTLASSLSIAGIPGAETVRGIDIIPGTGAGAGATFSAANGLHVVTLDAANTARIYQVNLTTGVATFLSQQTATLPNTDTATGVDFNPVNSRLRVLNAVGVAPLTDNTAMSTRNVAVTVATGATTADTDLAYLTNDVNAAFRPLVPAAAYTNNFLGAQATTLFGVDTNRDVLVRVTNPPSTGTLTTMGGLSIDASQLTGLDIDASNRAWLVTAPVTNASTGDISNTSVICRVNLQTGQADPLSNIAGGRLVDFAILPPGI